MRKQLLQGAVIFYKERVFLLEDSKQELVLPTFVLEAGASPVAERMSQQLARELALPLSDLCYLQDCGRTQYERYSARLHRHYLCEVSYSLFRLRQLPPQDRLIDANGAGDVAELAAGGQPSLHCLTLEEALEELRLPQDRALLLESYQLYSALYALE